MNRKIVMPKNRPKRSEELALLSLHIFILSGELYIVIVKEKVTTTPHRRAQIVGFNMKLRCFRKR